MREAADEGELVVAVMLGPDDDAGIARGGCRESALCVREIGEKRVVVHTADRTGIGVKACALRNPVWCVRHGPDGERVPYGEEIAAEPRRLERSLDVRSAANVQRVQAGVKNGAALRDGLARGGLRHHMRSQVTPLREP